MSASRTTDLPIDVCAFSTLSVNEMFCPDTFEARMDSSRVLKRWISRVDYGYSPLTAAAPPHHAERYRFRERMSASSLPMMGLTKDETKSLVCIRVLRETQRRVVA